jgi:hypothetical protein
MPVSIAVTHSDGGLLRDATDVIRTKMLRIVA